MKRLIICTLALMLAGPVISHAQGDDFDQLDQQDPTQYRDVQASQALKVVSYILTPVGMLLEWGLMRPLHYLATQTPVDPVLSGDQGPSFFTENNNASRVPPGTFAPSAINSTNNLHASNDNTTQGPVRSAGATLPPAESIPPSGPPLSSQPALH